MNNEQRSITDNAEVIDVGEAQIVEQAPMTTVGIASLLELAKTADARVLALNKLRLASIHATNNHDWIDQSGNPYLQASGAQKIAPLWGISWQIIQHSKVTGEDSYIWTTVLRLTDPAGRIVEAIGTRSSKDLLFAKRGDTYLLMSEVDEQSIKKSSSTNAVARGISAMVGLRNITWEELEAHGIKREGTHSVKRSSQTATSDDDANKKTELWNMLVEISGGDTKAANALLLETSSFVGKDNKTVPGVPLTKLKGKRLDVNLGKVRDMYKAFQSDMQQDGGAEEVGDEG